MQDLINLFFEYIEYIKIDILTAMMSVLIVSFITLGIFFLLRVFNITMKSKDDLELESDEEY